MTEVLAKPPIGKHSKSSKPVRRYPLTDKFFDTAINAAIQESLFSPIMLGERHDVRLRPAFDTACWAYLPPHRIYIGTDLLEKPSVKKGLSSAQQATYISNHYHHELGHALNTERDMPKIHRALKTIDAPFRTFNLMEDARMEAWYCKEAEFRFNWLEYEELGLNDRPECLLFALIQAEGDENLVRSAVDALGGEAPVEPGSEVLAQDKGSLGVLELLMTAAGTPSPLEVRTRLQALFPRVLEYYQRILAATGTLLVMPILKDWLDEYGRPPEPPNEDLTDLELSHKLMTDPKFVEAFEVKTKEVKALKLTTPGKPPPITAEDNLTAVAQRGTVLRTRGDPVELARATKLAVKFSKLFQAKSRYLATSAPQKRMSARNYCIGRPIYRKKDLTQKGVKNMFIEVDCSGSMNGSHIMEGKVLVSALSILATQGLVTGHVALSAVIDGVPNWELFKLPMGQKAIDRIEGFAGGEGLEYTLRENMKLAQAADYVFVYTDGSIGDKPIVKADFHKLGVYTWGLYVGDEPSCLEQLVQYFDKALMRTCVEDLVDAILHQLK
jgi:hypothetical protein